MSDEMRDKGVNDEEGIVSLLRLAGRREALPDDVKARLGATFRQELDAARGDRRRRAATRYLALAATALVAMVLLWPRQESVPLPVLAHAVRSSGDAMLDEDGLVPVGEGRALRVGDKLLTRRDGRLLLAWETGDVTLRMDRDTSIELRARDEIALVHGAVYIDTGQHAGGAVASAPGYLTVATDFGEVRDIGTQFLVKADAAELLVSVREGAVRVDSGSITLEGEATGSVGRALRVTSTEAVDEGDIQRFGGRWDWIHEVAPNFDTNNRALMEFLDWVAREMGCELAFADSESARAAAGVVLHGSLKAYSPERALTAILSTTVLERVESASGVIMIALREME